MSVLEAIIYIRKNADMPFPTSHFDVAELNAWRRYDEAMFIVRKYKWLNAFLKYIEWF